MADANNYLQSILSAVGAMLREVEENPRLLNDREALTVLRELDDEAHEALGNIQNMEG